MDCYGIRKSKEYSKKRALGVALYIEYKLDK